MNRASIVKFSVLLVLMLAVDATLTALAQRAGQSPFPNGAAGVSIGQRRGMRGVGERGRSDRRGCESQGRIQERTYLFKEGDKKGREISKKMEYDVFVPRKADRNEGSPLIIGLHGRNMPPSALLSCLLTGAEAGGYIVAAPMGYSETGYYGAGLQPPRDDPPNDSARSEKDVMNVLQLMRTEFRIDDRRIYIVGQSMGGAGALYLGTKYHDIWAAIAASAPAITSAHHPSELEAAASIPIIILHGTEDHTVPLGHILPWLDKMDALHMTYEFDQIPDADHPETIERGAGYIFDFFNKHIKPTAPGIG